VPILTWADGSFISSHDSVAEAQTAATAMTQVGCTVRWVRARGFLWRGWVMPGTTEDPDARVDPRHLGHKFTIKGD
jgi:hypothetical protein